jgi:hypothetical protein
MDEFKQKFVNVTRVAYCCAENSEVDGFECEWVPLMNVAAFVGQFPLVVQDTC